MINIQNKDTRLFLGKNRKWVASPEQAKVFDSATEAVIYAVREDLHRIQVVMAGTSGEPELVICGNDEPWRGNSVG